MLVSAEIFDAWRVFPRLLVAGYGWLLYEVVQWYMKLDYHVIKGCVPSDTVQCVVEAPTTQHAALVTAVVGISAAVFGLYANSGRKWDQGIHRWDDDSKTTDRQDTTN